LKIKEEEKIYIGGYPLPRDKKSKGPETLGASA
jgi:hypothetical protein